ncbi:MAG: zinc-ribbon domain-containing protein, partial [Emcibacter sp.]|nr:zinc-ribbon domain-containing protein [Emcibacter sp.]
MILTCPECSARYVIDPAALLPSGRMVRCAKCKHSWKEPAPDADTPMVDQAEATGPETQTPPDSENDSKNDSSDGGRADNAQNAGKNNSTEIDKTQDTGDDTGEDEFAIKRARRKKRPRPLPKGSNLPALQNHKHGDILWGWYGLGAFVVVIVGSFLIFQTSISDIWPPAQKLYHALGMNNHDLGPKIDPENGHEMAEEQTKIPYDEQFKIENTTPSKTQTGKLVTLKVE